MCRSQLICSHAVSRVKCYSLIFPVFFFFFLQTARIAITTKIIITTSSNPPTTPPMMPYSARAEGGMEKEYLVKRECEAADIHIYIIRHTYVIIRCSGCGSHPYWCFQQSKYVTIFFFGTANIHEWLVFGLKSRLAHIETNDYLWRLLQCIDFQPAIYSYCTRGVCRWVYQVWTQVHM